MNATLNLRLFSGKRWLTTTDQSKFRLRCSAETTVVHRSNPKMMRFESLIGEPPAHGLPPLHPPYADIEAQSDEPDDQHSRHHQLVPSAGVARTDHQVAQPGIHGHHFRPHHHKPA